MSDAPNAAKLDTPHFPEQLPGRVKDLQESYRQHLPLMSFEIDASLFLKKFLPFPENHALTLLEAVKAAGLYQNSKWTGLPKGTKPSGDLAALDTSSPQQSTAPTQSTQLADNPPADSSADPSSSLHPAESTASSPSTAKPRVKESSLYEPFVNIANEIAVRAPQITNPVGESAQRLKGRWVNTHDRALVSGNPHANKVIPDISFLSNPRAETIERISLSSVAEDGHSTGPSQTSEDAVQAAPTSGDSSNIAEQIESHLWLQAFTVVEVKPNKDGDSALPQLATYVRHIFMEQLDRHFVLAFTLNLDALRIHLFDRSGVISSSPINIHESPTQFITAIAAFSWLPPVDLGWDPSVHVWDEGEIVRSYEARMKDYSCAYHVPWIFDGFNNIQTDVPNLVNHDKGKGRDNGTQATNSCSRYVSIRSLTLEDAKRLWGRGTLVLEVISLDDWVKKNAKAQVYVMKQSWQRLPGFDDENATIDLSNTSLRSEQRVDAPNGQSLCQSLDSEPFEAFILRGAALSSRLKDAGFVRVDERKVDTFSYARKGVQPQVELRAKKAISAPRSTSLQTSTTVSSMDLWSKVQHREPSASRGSKSRASSLATDTNNTEHANLANRSLARLFFKLPGVPIKYFRNKRELLNGLRGAIADHEKCYRRGIIQRDVSINNILLSGDTGHLIDFDHSKLSTRMAFPNPPAKRELATDERDLYSKSLNDHLFDAIERLYGAEIGAYLYRAKPTWLSRYPHLSRLLSFDDLGWIDELYTIPNFKGRQPGPGRVTGTPAFISCHLKKRYWLSHTAIHDMESFWWVLVYICIGFSGPGVPKLDKAIRSILGIYFSGPEISQVKKEGAFINNGELESLLNNIDSYFDDLKALIRSWHSVIKLAFEFETGMEFHYPHGIIIHLIDEALHLIDEPATAQDEDDWRRRMLEENAEAILTQKTVHVRPVKRKSRKSKKSRGNTGPSDPQSSNPDFRSPTGSPRAKKQRK
ncbi:hypothetical protein D9756_006629 [Leucocoprinus leucothites]|uniref:Fungal-type protein kinase domain-containing protein n=1 Tax=Leucocoprinus leucothites TaxID=201217 RepID=A0A8H5LGW7_9AGAR|nr:hypothetical protein D9756_006629 [Leucoagaricus leucothites]